MEQEVPQEPGRVVEALWRALHASDVAAPRVFSDRMKRWISDEDTQAGMFDSTEKALEKPVDKFNRVFALELKELALRRNRGTDRKGTTDGWILSQNDYDAAMRGQDLSDEERVEEKKPEESQQVPAGKFVITENDQKMMASLGYSKEQIAKMSADEIAKIVGTSKSPKFGPPPKAA